MLILGNQLFHPKGLQKLWESSGPKNSPRPLVFMREDRELCTHFRYHKHKIIFFLAAMRNYAEELRAHGFEVHYQKLDTQDTRSFEIALGEFIQTLSIQSLITFEIEDKFLEQRLLKWAKDHQHPFQIWESPLFLTSRSDFKDYLQKYKKPFMKTFYEGQRKKLKILVTEDLKPLGGQWSFDEENRKPLPKNLKPPGLPEVHTNPLQKEVLSLVDRFFSDHPGESKDFWLPTTRAEAQNWFQDFLEKRFAQFGPYEDALSNDEPFLFHSVLAPLLNVGLLTPRRLLQDTLRFAEKNSIPLNSLEGFVRQVMGWREFIRGIYQNYSEHQDSSNHWNHQRALNDLWYRGETGIPPLDGVLQKTRRYGYAHHIERLMILGNLMLLLEVHPQEAHRWFMEMFVDSSDWVMGPNVYGMALFSDGGVFATKPYICGSNYYKKMGGPYPKGPWQDEVDGLYWSFIYKHKTFFSSNPRLGMMVRMLDKMSSDRKDLLFKAADGARARLTKPR